MMPPHRITADRITADWIAADWIAADWGTSRLRVWALDAADHVLAEGASDQGMGRLTTAGFEPALLSLIGGWLGAGVTPVLVCGMAGARQGWIEAPYRPVPCPPAGPGAVSAPVGDPRLAVRLLPGLCQNHPPDVMRGEETQIAGLLAQEPGFHGVLCLPGTHAKWARVADGQVTSFRTAMTGELHALLAGQSVLRHAMDPGFDEGLFDQTCAEILAAPERLTAALFGIRAASLVHPAPGAGAARLSGLLIGAELAAMRDLWQDAPVTIIGAGPLSRLYHRVLPLSRVLDGGALSLAGLVAARPEVFP